MQALSSNDFHGSRNRKVNKFRSPPKRLSLFPTQHERYLVTFRMNAPAASAARLMAVWAGGSHSLFINAHSCTRNLLNATPRHTWKGVALKAQSERLPRFNGAQVWGDLN